jgi:hypothetical protein
MFTTSFSKGNGHGKKKNEKGKQMKIEQLKYSKLSIQE